MTFNNFEELVHTIENDLGEEFKNDFRQSRKSLAGLTNLPNNLLFSEFDSQKTEWVFNRGGKKEIQYHIFLREGNLGYGLAINSQRGSFNNDDPAEIANDFGNAFKNLSGKIYQILPNYSFIIGSENKLGSMEEGEFILFGNLIPVSNNTIQNDDYKQLLSDLSKQIEVYKLVYERKNLIARNRKQLSTQMESIQKQIKLLKYKKQIILQGPPGTGKTREAKLIANNIFLNELNENSYFGNNLIKNETIFSVAKNTKYRVKSISENYIELEGEDIQDKKITKNKIIDFVKDQNWNAVSNGNDRGAQAIAYHLYQKFIENQFKLIQFHPSYTYEDFVRGIVAKPNPDGEGIIYEAENKTLGDFATKALDNFLASKGQLTIDSEFQTRFNTLIDEINSEINSGKIFKFGDKSTAEIISVGNEYLIYSFPERKEIRYKLLFSDIEKVYNKRQEIYIPIDLRDKEKELGLQMKGKYPYYFMILKSLEKIELPENFNLENSDVEEKSYILVIDEINRANLSSVLGELIYALEYRGEEVESMYEVDGSQKLILPPNLYIIGTMNTADRSVGHIDYAIRRRFAFVEVLPEKLKDNDEIFFNTDAFIEVAKLFIKVEENNEIDFEKAEDSEYLSDDFSAKDVALGHSYFIADKKKISEDNKQEYFNMKMKYEVIPILNEYLKDGVFNEKATVKIKEIEQRFA
ncbi:AAA family ATPase [Cloacibacterium normanense]|uniref:AAA family ATPase n=1 Tax=Cloacibacterium normanense TaxID=237258 RepID=UPI00391C5E60